MEDRGTGEYVSSFSAIRAATYRVSVTLGGLSIAGSPFAAIVLPGEVSAGTSYATGEGLNTALCGQKARSPTCPRAPHVAAACLGNYYVRAPVRRYLPSCTSVTRDTGRLI